MASWLTILLVVGVAECGQHHASIKSQYGQLVTSSTLKWTHVNSGQTVTQEAVPSGTGNSDKFVCRAEHHGALLVGQTTQVGGYCMVGFLTKLYKKHKYELLINVDRAARLEWKSYSKYAGVPEGAVAGVDESSTSAAGENDIFIGRHLGSSAQWLPGAVEVPRRSANFGLMRVFDSHGRMSEHNSGDVLVEVEPERYEIEIHDDLDTSGPRRPKKTTRQDVVLAKSSLFRFDEGKDQEARLQKVLSYEYEKSEYYGQVPGMIRALATTISLPNGQVQSVLWGLPERSQQHETLMVGHSLRHFKAVDVSVVGIRITEESPYRATLTAVFPDGSKRQRTIDGVAQRIYLNNIRPEYSRVYKIKDTVVHHQGPTTSTTPPSTNSFHERSSSHSSMTNSHQKKKKDRMLSDENSQNKQQLILASQSSAANLGPWCSVVLLCFLPLMPVL